MIFFQFYCKCIYCLLSNISVFCQDVLACLQIIHDLQYMVVSYYKHSTMIQIVHLMYPLSNRDQQRLVPFRDSKLTRLLQNYFNGSGRAVMIVNVSQSASMFDDTLHVFKFSAIAKQVKHIEKPPEPPKKQKERKVLPPVQRPSIEWEVRGKVFFLLLPIATLDISENERRYNITRRHSKKRQVFLCISLKTFTPLFLILFWITTVICCGTFC